MSEKPVAVLLSPVLPEPGGSGRALRAWGWLQTLQRDYRVHVLVATAPGEGRAIAADYPAETVLPIAPAIVTAGRRRLLLTVLFPFSVLFYRRGVIDWLPCEPATLHALTASLDGQPVQRIVVFRLYLHDVAQLLVQRFPLARTELDLDDFESRTRLSIAGCLLRMRRYREALISGASALQFALLERFMSARYTSVYLAAAEDCQRFATRLSGNVACRPNTIGMPPSVMAPAPSSEICLLFVGTLNYAPNEEAVRDMLTGLLPELQSSGLRWRLTVVGRHASTALASLLNSTARVEFLGEVDDLAACYAAAQVVLVPVRAGGGTKLKTLEGFAHCRPVVSTAQGIRGLGAVPGQHYLPAHDPMQFAQAILQLAGDPALARRIAEAGWQLWHTHFRQP